MKNIPIALQAHKELEVTTLCRLVKIICTNGSIYAFTGLDRDVSYDDGDGVLSYKWLAGVDLSRLASSAGTGVDNAEATGLVSALAAMGITEGQLHAGLFDFAEMWIYQVNYNDLTAGRHEIIGRGSWGEVSTAADSFSGEFRSLIQRFKQQVTLVASLTCRARFGSQVGEERYPCTKVRTWVSATITAVDGAEADRKFTCSALGQATGYFVPGIFRVLTGDNAGFEMEVTSFTVGGIVELALPAYNDFSPSDTGELSQDCDKSFGNPDHGCLYHHGPDRVLRFRGEPLIPIGREGELSSPGAEL